MSDFSTTDPKGRAAVYNGDTVFDGNVNVLEGKGTLTLTEEGPNKGTSYTGQFKAGKYHGVGTWVGSSGNKYEGSWKAGSFHGQG